MRTESRAELDRLLEEAIRLLESTDLRGANEALKKASVEAASLREANLTPEFAGSDSSRARTRRDGRESAAPRAESGVRE